ncbi:MAG TPA: orotate phosphoribosyltransferase [Gemmatimonadota bacterium]|nr:orotate phosphoribosyltransferase [Gemmatimonadota bacterium]
MTAPGREEDPGQEAWLDRLRARGALLEGHFRLSSGLHSPHYVQCALFLQHPDEAGRSGLALADRLRERISEPPTAVVSPAIGGLILGHELGRALGCRAVWVERGADGRMELRRGFRFEPAERVVVVEDVVTTAGSLREVIQVVEARGARVVGVAALVDRSGGRVDWEVPAVRLVRLDAIQLPAGACPQCQAGVPLRKPGSRPDPETEQRPAEDVS